MFGLSITALLFGLITLLSIPAALIWVPNSKDTNVRKTEEKIQKSLLWKDSTILWALMTGTLVAMIYQGMFTATLSYLVQVHNASMITIHGMVIGAASLAGILQAIRWGWEPWLAPWIGKISDGKHGRRRVLILSLLLASVLFVFIPFQIPLYSWLIVILGIQITATSLTTLTDAIASDAASSSSKYFVLTAYSIAVDLGAAVGPFIGYVLNESVAPYAAYWGAGIILLFMTLAWMSPNKGKLPLSI